MSSFKSVVLVTDPTNVECDVCKLTIPQEEFPIVNGRKIFHQMCWAWNN